METEVETGGGDKRWRNKVETGGGDRSWRLEMETEVEKGGGNRRWRLVVETGGGDRRWRHTRYSPVSANYSANHVRSKKSHQDHQSGSPTLSGGTN